MVSENAPKTVATGEVLSTKEQAQSGRLVWKRAEQTHGQAALSSERSAAIAQSVTEEVSEAQLLQRAGEESLYEKRCDDSLKNTGEHDSPFATDAGAEGIGQGNGLERGAAVALSALEGLSTDAGAERIGQGNALECATPVALSALEGLQIPFSYGEDAEAERVVKNILSILPGGLRAEIEQMARMESFFYARLSEITVRMGGVCSVRLDGRLMRLSARVGRNEMDALLRALTHGAIYAYQDRIRRGYLSAYFGGRVGVVGVASVENGAVSAVSSPSTFVFRIPHSRLSGAEQLASFFRRHVKVGWLLISAPGVGKTSALRALARALSIGEGALSCAAVDERGEFLAMDCEGRTLDLLCGYPREMGMEIALRSLGAEVILVDEIGSREDEEGLRQHLLAGGPIVATAHASSVEEAVRRPLLSRFLSLGAFDVIGLLSRRNGGIEVQNYMVK